MTSDNLVSVKRKHRAYRCWRSSVCDMCNLFLWGWETECSFHLLTSFTDVSYKVFILFMVFFNGKWEKSEVPHTANAHFDVWEPEKVPKHWRDPTTVISKPLFPPISAFNREEQRNDSVSFLLFCRFSWRNMLFLKTIQSAENRMLLWNTVKCKFQAPLLLLKCRPIRWYLRLNF